MCIRIYIYHAYANAYVCVNIYIYIYIYVSIRVPQGAPSALKYISKKGVVCQRNQLVALRVEGQTSMRNLVLYACSQDRAVLYVNILYLDTYSHTYS